MDLAATQAALAGWIVAQTGLDAGLVFFENAPRAFVAGGTYALLSWVSDAGVGEDETRYEDDGTAAPGSNLTATVVGCRILALQVAFESFDQRPDAPNARALAARLRDRLRLPSSLAAFAAANLGLVDATPVLPADYRVDQRWIARALFDVRFNATSFERDTNAPAGSLESVDVTSAAASEAGIQLPAASQMNAVNIARTAGT